MTTDWTSRCESGNCLQTRRVHLADGGEYVELRDTETEGTLLVTVAAWEAHEAALRAEGYAEAVARVKTLATSKGPLFTPHLIASFLTEVRDDTSDDG
jgi:hypothetical protein